MTAEQFQEECGIRLIDPALAIENEKILQALMKKQDYLVLTLLNTEF